MRPDSRVGAVQKRRSIKTITKEAGCTKFTAVARPVGVQGAASSRLSVVGETGYMLISPARVRGILLVNLT